MATKTATSPQRKQYIKEQISKIDEVLNPLIGQHRSISRQLELPSGQISEEERTRLQAEKNSLKGPIQELHEKRTELLHSLESGDILTEMASQRFVPNFAERIRKEQEKLQGTKDRWEELGFVSPEKLLTLCEHMVQLPGHDELKDEINNIAEDIRKLMPDLEATFERVSEIHDDFAPLMKKYQDRLKSMEREFGYTPVKEEWYSEESSEPEGKLVSKTPTIRPQYNG